MLSREEAVRKHRAMWNWIGNMLKSGLWRSVVSNYFTEAIGDIVILLKYSYLNMVNETELRSSCYCCMYVASINSDSMVCDKCPVEWPMIPAYREEYLKWFGSDIDDVITSCNMSVYRAFFNGDIETFEAAGDAAYQIASLPEKGDIS